MNAHQQTEAVANKFMQAFGRCHRIYDSAGLLSNMALTELGMAGHCSHKVHVHVHDMFFYTLTNSAF